MTKVFVSNLLEIKVPNVEFHINPIRNYKRFGFGGTDKARTTIFEPVET
jgi:hypothetical protein